MLAFENDAAMTAKKIDRFLVPDRTSIVTSISPGFQRRLKLEKITKGNTDLD
jgi:hypothetical protein